MVYESDFYTTRRPYSRPTITSYSVTLVPRYGGIVRATPVTVGQSIPYIAHAKLTPHIVAVPATYTPRSIIWAELDRISHRSRPHLSYDPKEDFLNDRDIVNFDDEARRIRAQSNALLRRIHTPVVRSSRPLPLSLTYNRPELAVPERITSDDYIHRMLEPTRSIPYEVSVMSYYPGLEPLPARVNIGKGHLACVTYAGGRGYPRRKQYYLEDKNIRDEIKFRSYYKSLDKPGLLAEGTAKAEAEKEVEVAT